MKDKVSLATLALAKAYTDEHSSGGGTSNYNDLTHKPTVNGVEFKGTLTGESLGLVDAEDGKGLSTNDYTDAEKTKLSGIATGAEVNVQSDWNQTTDSADDFIKNKPDMTTYVQKSQTAGLLKNDGTVDTTTTGVVSANTTAITNIKDGTSIDSFGDVETALANKVDKVAGKGLSKNDYTDADKTIVDGVTTALAGKIDTTQKGASNGVAELDANGRVPSSQLPSYVDDVLEYASQSAFPATGETGKIYIALDTNKTYRWGGTEYVEISESLALGETSSTAYAGNKGKANADAITAMKDGSSIDSFGDVETALAGKQATLTFDNVPTNGSNNPVKSNGIYDAIDDVYKTNGVLGAKNLLPQYVGTNTHEGVTYTADANGVVTCSGTVPGSDASIWRKTITIKAGKYKIYGGENIPTRAGSSVFVALWSGSNYYSPDAGTDDTYTFSSDTSVGFTLRIGSGVDSSSYTFYPMIYLASDTDKTYRPYAMTNRELTNEMFPRSEQAILGAKNINATKYVSQTSSSVVWTANDDGSITAVSGTATGNNGEIGASVNSAFVAPFTAQVKIIGGLTSSIYLYPYDYTDSARPYKDATKTTRLAPTDNQWGDTPLEFYMIEGHKYIVAGRVIQGSSANNNTMYPRLLLATDTDDTYAPYAMTNRELTYNKFDKYKVVYESLDTGNTTFEEHLTAIYNVFQTLNDEEKKNSRIRFYGRTYALSVNAFSDNVYTRFVNFEIDSLGALVIGVFTISAYGCSAFEYTIADGSTSKEDISENIMTDSGHTCDMFLEVARV